MSDLTPSVSSPQLFHPIKVVVVKPEKKHYWLYGLLFLATVFTTLVVGAGYEFNFFQGNPTFLLTDSMFGFFPIRWILAEPSRLLLGVPFAASLMLILFAHEMGHYIACRYYKVNATLPFFIPAPTLFGTMGAFIRIRSQIRSRAALFDIGIAGPIAGFVFAVAILLIALPFSRVGVQVAIPDVQLGYPLIFDLALRLIPMHNASGGVVPLQDVHLHPMAIAAWVGMFATALNLLPGGQLDGGHIVYSLGPRIHRYVSWAAIGVLVPLAVYCWAGWALWAVLLALTGMRHPAVPEYPAIEGKRRWLAIVALLMLILTFAPAPTSSASVLKIIQQNRASH
jgi:membrane-associated protease RseP (regulator of RpoE activity)